MYNKIGVHVDAEILFNRTVKSTFIHYAVYYQHSTNEYRPFLVNGWEDFCGYLNGDDWKNGGKNVLISFIYRTLRNYTNVRSCPIQPKTYYFKMDNVSVNVFNYDQLVPAGRYRIEIDVHDGYKGKQFATLKVYGSVSDHRVEKF